MARKLDDKPIETIVPDLVQGIIDVNELKLTKANQRAAFLQALEERPALLTKVDKDNEKQFFTVAINKNPEYFVHLKREQYTNDLAQVYLFDRLSRSASKKSSQTILVRKSLDDKVVFMLSYLSTDADELYYLDKELQVPVSLRSSIVLTLKLDDAVALIDRLDTHITQLGEEKIKGVVSDLVANHYKSYLNSYINEKQIGYYTLCTSLNDLQNGFTNYISETFKPFGLSVSDFVVKNIAIPKDIQHRLEDQAFKIRQRRSDVEADSEFAKLSLESYEAKLAIHTKYPNAEVTLTEYEKDLALKRYLIKSGRDVEETVDHTIDIDHNTLHADSTLNKLDDIVPDVPTGPNTFKQNFIICAVIAAVVSLILLAVNAVAGLVVLLLSFVIFGLIASVNSEKFSSPEVEPTVAPPTGQIDSETIESTADTNEE